MTDAPDPLGKRALFWVPAERDDGDPRRPTELVTAGKHALFSPEARQRAATMPPTSGPVSTGAREANGHGVRRLPGTSVSPPARRGAWDRMRVACSSCGADTEVHLAEFALLHMPVWIWWPGRGYTRFMTCPTCRRRTWVRATWAPMAR